MKTFADRCRAQYTDGYAYTSTKVKGCFVSGNASTLLHLVVDTCARWPKEVARPRLVALTKCGSQITKATSYLHAPEGMNLCDICVFADFGPFALYRYFDAAGDLLYIGQTGNPLARLIAHSSGSYPSQWWPLVATWSLELHNSRPEVLLAERAAIRAERPRFNVAHIRT